MDYRQLYEAERDRAARLEAQLALSRQPEQWRMFETALSNMSDFAYIFDLEGRFVYANRSLLDLWGKTSLEQAAGKTFTDLGYPTDLAERLNHQIQQVIATKTPLRDQVSYISPTGVQGVYEHIFVPVISDAGDVLAVTGTSRNVTSRASIESALRESEQRFSAAFADAPVGMILMKPTGEFLDANQTYLRMLGYTLDELAGRTSDHFTHPDDVAATHEYGGGLRRRDRDSGNIEKRYIRKDGTFLWARAAGTMRYDEQGNPILFVAIIEDITQQKAAEDALRRSEENLRLIFAQAPVAICVLNGASLTFDLVNACFQSLFPGRELMGHALIEAVPELREDLIGILRGVVETGKPFQAEEFAIPLDSDGDGIPEDHWFTFVCHPLREDTRGVFGLVMIAVDVTSHMRARHELERANAELAEFAFVASHDLQEPLRMVNIYAQRLTMGLGKKTDEEIRKYAAEISNGAYRMEALTRDLLQYSQANHERGTVSYAGQADLNVACAHAIEALRNTIEETGAVVECGALPSVVGDEGQYAHVFQNLIANALKYRNESVTPKVEVSASTGENGRAVVRVRDNGIGFDQAYAERVFGLFKRLHTYHQYPGTGLGLAICKRIVERYGGTIWAESESGKGATFFFELIRR